MINQNLQRRIMDLEDRMLRITKSPTSSFHTLSSLQQSPTDIMYGLSTFSSSSQATIKEPPRNRTTRTHHDMLARCHTNECTGMPNAGLMNSTVICYANALFQALASCNHLTTLFDDRPQDTSGSFSLNHAFCAIIHSMVKHQPSQQDVVDPSYFIKLFCDHHTDFKFEESKYSYDICVEAIRLDHDILTISRSLEPIQLPPI